MRCGDVMNTRVHTCSGQTTAAECARLMRDQKITVVPVVDDKRRVKGIVTMRDLVHQVLATEAGGNTPVTKFMRDGVTCQAGDCVSKVRASLITKARNTAFVTNDDGHCLGMISIPDLEIPDENIHVSERFERRDKARAAQQPS